MLIEKRIDLFNEQITTDNVFRLAKFVALTATKAYMKYAENPVIKMYDALRIDISQMNNVNHTFSNSFDFVQTAALFLCENIGKVLSDTYKLNNRGRSISILEMASRMVSREIGRTLRINKRRVDEDKLKTVIDTKPILEESTEESYQKVDEIIEKLHLDELEETTLKCRMSGYSYSHTARIISRVASNAFCAMNRVKKKYIMLIGSRV